MYPKIFNISFEKYAQCPINTFTAEHSTSRADMDLADYAQAYISYHKKFSDMDQTLFSYTYFKIIVYKIQLQNVQLDC